MALSIALRTCLGEAKLIALVAAGSEHSGWDGLYVSSAQEVADAMGISRRSVTRAQQTALSKLRKSEEMRRLADIVRTELQQSH